MLGILKLLSSVGYDGLIFTFPKVQCILMPTSGKDHVPTGPQANLTQLQRWGGKDHTSAANFLNMQRVGMPVSIDL